MDTSKEYIKMCEKSEEIQKAHKPKDGNFIKFEGEKVEVMCQINEGWTYDNSYIWLPRQDQLQEMVFKDYPRDKEFCDTLMRSLWAWFDYQKHNQFTSMEQLWLAFVMKERYSKTWDGEKWLK